MRSQRTSILALALLGSLAACRALAPTPPAQPADLPTVELDPWESQGLSVEGREIEYAVFGEGEITVLLIAGIHGNEEAGTPLLLHLAEELEQAAEPPVWMANRRLVILPRSNPDALEAGIRHNANGVDINRNFPADNFRPGGGRGSEPLCEPESLAIHGLFEHYSPDRVLTFHMPVDVIDYDGPAEGLAKAMGAVSPLPVRRIGSRPGSLGSWVGLDQGVPIVTVELPASARQLDEEAAWELYGPMILAAIQYEEQ